MENCFQRYFLSADPEHARAAVGALALHGLLAVLHGDALWVLHFNLVLALHAVCFSHTNSPHAFLTCLPLSPLPHNSGEQSLAIRRKSLPSYGVWNRIKAPWSLFQLKPNQFKTISQSRPPVLGA